MEKTRETNNGKVSHAQRKQQLAAIPPRAEAWIE